MTDEEIIEVVSALKANDKTMKDSGISDNLWGKAVECITFLQFENAVLCERLSHSLELPYMEQTVSQYGTEDTVLYYMENDKLQQECFNNKFPEQLQARLAELKGEKSG